MSTKTILIAHRSAAVRDRFAAALADARHAFVSVGSEAEARAAAQAPASPINLALVDLALAEDGAAFVRDVRQRPDRVVPVVVFSGSLPSAALVPALAAMNVAYINEHASTPQILPALAPHLFPDNFNRRASLRIALGVPVSYQAGQTIAGAVTLDVSKGGVAIRTMNPLSKGTSVLVKFRLPGTPSEIAAQGHIAWSDRKTGMGVQFEKVSLIDQRMLERWVDERG
ncbi:MAG TPA: PilZ domain-containing protein [Vicinamibacterales bacterium]|nr:PilZ domain-containing protein [Vicinamibacterales bacterium]